VGGGGLDIFLCWGCVFSEPPLSSSPGVGILFFFFVGVGGLRYGSGCRKGQVFLDRGGGGGVFLFSVRLVWGWPAVDYCLWRPPAFFLVKQGFPGAAFYWSMGQA